MVDRASPADQLLADVGQPEEAKAVRGAIDALLAIAHVAHRERHAGVSR